MTRLCNECDHRNNCPDRTDHEIECRRYRPIPVNELKMPQNWAYYLIALLFFVSCEKSEVVQTKTEIIYVDSTAIKQAKQDSIKNYWLNYWNYDTAIVEVTTNIKGTYFDITGNFQIFKLDGNTVTFKNKVKYFNEIQCAIVGVNDTSFMCVKVKIGNAIDSIKLFGKFAGWKIKKEGSNIKLYE